MNDNNALVTALIGFGIIVSLLSIAHAINGIEIFPQCFIEENLK